MTSVVVPATLAGQGGRILADPIPARHGNTPAAVAAVMHAVRAARQGSPGGTILVRGSRMYAPRDGYAIARAADHGPAIAIPGPDVPPEIFAERYALAMGAAAVGWWSDPATGAAMVEATDLVEDRALAVALGRARGQVCVYEFATGRTIDTSAPAPAGFTDPVTALRARALGIHPATAAALGLAA